ncbi:MAG: UDP-glucose 4-epimerase GalE [Verrucomicrobiota bacterium]
MKSFDEPPVVLVTGGAGYIGSHTVRLLAEKGQRVIVLDNLVYGHREAILSKDVTLVEGDLSDPEVVDRLFEEYPIEAVIHFGAYAYVGESVTQPLKYYGNNTAAALTILRAMERKGCDKFIFSSTCATYGNPVKVPMNEDHTQDPINPYGRSKLMLEWILRDCSAAFGLRSVSLRYFNASGCSADGMIGEDHDPETHLIPNVLMAATGERDKVSVFGTDYDTPDGTCIRDYIHVEDLATAHLCALDYLRQGGETTAVNLGTGDGVSVKEIIQIAEDVCGKEIPLEYGDRREGDPPRLLADPAKAKEVLGWEAQHKDVRVAIENAWQWMTGPKNGRYKA